MRATILVAPAAKRFAPGAPSEDRVVYDLVTGVAAREPNLRFVCMAEEIEGAAPGAVEPVAIGRRRTEEFGSAALPFRLAWAAWRRGGLRGVDLVHHALPFAAGRTFSLLGYEAHRRGIPLVVGPVQTPLEWTGPDEHGGQLGVVDHPRLRHHVTALAAAAAPVVSAPLHQLSGVLLRRADRVVVWTPAAASMVERFGVPSTRVVVIPPPVRVPTAAPTLHRDGTGPLRVVTAGYLIDRKGVDHLVAAVGVLASAGERIELDVAGDGPAGDDLRRLACRCGAGPAVRFHGWLAQGRVAELVAAADVYVSMSRAESWGLAVADALGTGLVVVSAANIGARAMADLGAPVCVVPIDDRPALVAELRRLCRADRSRLASLGAAGARWAARHLGQAVIAERWAAVYRAALEAARHRPVVTSTAVARW